MITEPKCVLWKRKGAEYVQKQTEGLTIAEELEFWRREAEYLKIRRQKVEERLSGQSLLSILRSYDNLEISDDLETELTDISDKKLSSSVKGATNSENQEKPISINQGVRLCSLNSQTETTLPSLSDDVEAELAAMSNLLDETLWILARSTMSHKNQEALAMLSQEAKMRSVTYQEQEEYDRLLGLSNRTMLRRAQAASLLSDRGHDMGDPSVLQEPY